MRRAREDPLSFGKVDLARISWTISRNFGQFVSYFPAWPQVAPEIAALRTQDPLQLHPEDACKPSILPSILILGRISPSRRRPGNFRKFSDEQDLRDLETCSEEIPTKIDAVEESADASTSRRGSPFLCGNESSRNSRSREIGDRE